jgi:hypothetical protein
MHVICEPPSPGNGIREDSETSLLDEPLKSGEFGSGSGDLIEQRRFRWMVALVVGLLIALAGPFLAGRIYTADDLGAFHLPMRAFYADCLARGESFDWSPQMYCGFYLTGEGQIGGYHPLHLLLYRLLPLPAAFDLECLLSYPFMLVGMYLLLRRWGIRRDAALFGGLTFTFSGFSLLHFLHVNGVAVVAHLPWLLLAIHAVVSGGNRNRRLLGGVALAVLTGSQLLLGYPQYVWLSLLAELGYAIFLRRTHQPDGTSIESEKRRQHGFPFRTYLEIAAWLGLGGLVAAVQLLPTFDALSNSSRAAAGSDFTGWGSLHPLNVLQLIAPYLFATRVVGQNTHELGLYAGSVTLILAACCLAVRPSGARLQRLRQGAVMLVVIGFLLAFGSYGPVGWLIARLPLMNNFRFQCRAIVLVNFGLAVLATIGVVSLLGADRTSSRNSQQHRIGRLLGTIVALSLTVAIGAPVLWPDYVARPALIWAGPILISAAAMLVALAYRGKPWAQPALMLLAAIDLGAYGMSYAVYPQTARFDEYLAAIPQPPSVPAGRLALDLLAPNQPGLHVGNQLLLLGYERADGYAGLEPSRQLDYRQTAALRASGVGCVAPTANVADRGSLTSIARPTSPGEATSAAESNGWFAIEPLPKARLVTRALISADPAGDISRIQLESTALVEEPHNLSPSQLGMATIVVDRPGDIRVAVNSPSRQLLVLAESFDRGWQATINGQSRPIMRINGDFMGCIVEPGQSDAHFEFRPASLRYGRWLSVFGLGLIVAAALRAALPRRISEIARRAIPR